MLQVLAFYIEFKGAKSLDVHKVLAEVLEDAGGY